MIKAEHISVSIHGKLLLDDVSVQFEPGQLHLIMGPNGAGKSTLVHVLSKLRTPTQGVVTYNQKNIQQTSDKELSKIRAVLSQHIDLAFPLKVWEVVMMGRYPHFSRSPGENDREAIEQAMKSFDLLDFKDRDYLSLSGGEKQRVHFARVWAQLWYPVMNACRYLLLDEPLTFLDVFHQFQFMTKIKEMVKRSDLVVVGVVHDLNLAARFADQLVLLKDGKVQASGTRERVLTKENIFAAYQLMPQFLYHEGVPIVHF